MDSRPTHSLTNAPSQNVLMALEETGYSNTTTSLITNMVEMLISLQTKSGGSLGNGTYVL